MNYLLLYFVFPAAALDWLAVARGWKPLEYVAKPGTMLLLIAWMWQNGSFRDGLLWFGIGLFVSLIGDILLMLPNEQFLAALAAFLLAQVMYIVGLNLNTPPLTLPALLVILLVGVTAVQIYRRLSAGLRASGKTALQKPVMIYSFAISLMLISALWTLVRPDEGPGAWQAGAALSVSAGGLLFFLSETLLAWNRFITALPGGRALVHATYHLGQVGLATGALLHYLG